MNYFDYLHWEIKKMRIAINTLSVDPQAAGIRTFFINLAKYLPNIDKSNEYFLIITKTNKDLFKGKVGKNFHKIVLPFNNRNKFLKFFFEQFIIPILIAVYKIHILYCPANIASILAPCKIVLEIHGFHYALKPEMFSWKHLWYHRILIPLSVLRANKVVMVSNYLKRQVIKKLPWLNISKVNIIYEGIDQDFLNSKYEHMLTFPWMDDPYLLSVGSLFKYKNVDKIIKAFAMAKLKGKIPHRLIIVGKDPEGNLDTLESLAKEFGIEDEIIFLGLLEYSLIRSLYGRATMLIYLSEEETFGYPILEAMASGIPIIGSNLSSVPEIIGDSGIIVDPRDTNRVAEMIMELFYNKKLRESIIKKGKNRIKLFLWPKVLKERIRLFEEVSQIKTTKILMAKLFMLL